MALINLHTDWTLGSYFADRNDLVKQEESDALYALVLSGEQGLTFPVAGRPTPKGLQPYLDELSGGRFSLAVGYGFDLYKNTKEKEGQATFLEISVGGRVGEASSPGQLPR